MSRSTNIRTSILALGVGTFLSGSAAAQVQIHNFLGTKTNDRAGASVANARDMNGDGTNEILVGFPEDGNFFFAGKGFVQLRDGQSGALLNTFAGLPADVSFGTAVASAGFVDLDNVPDFIIGAPASQGVLTGSGRIAVISGATGLEILSIFGSTTHENLGRSVCGVGDLNGDGFGEIMAGSEVANSDTGIVRVYSGNGGALMYSFAGTGFGSRLGTSLDSLQDIDNDSVPDLLVGSGFDGYYVFSGANGAELRHSLIAGQANYGFRVASVADITGDSVQDIIVSSVQVSVFSPGTGRVYVRNGKTDAALFSFDGANVGDTFGSFLDDAGDWNNDTTTDFIVASDPISGQSFVTIHSGVNGALISTIFPDTPTDDVGESVAGLGDSNGNGKIRVVVGAPDAKPSFTFQGYARVYESPFNSCYLITQYCTPNVNSTGNAATIGSVGNPDISDNLFFLSSANCPASVPGLFFYGPNQTDVPLSDGRLCVGSPQTRLPVVMTNGSGIATSHVDLNLPNNVIVAGTWNFQFWFRDPNAGSGHSNLSKALTAVWCN